MRHFILFAIVAAFLMGAGFTGFAKSADQPDHIEIIVKPGDTLWHIAQEYYNDSHDIRMVIDEIKLYNKLADATIRPGETLQLPQ